MLATLQSIKVREHSDPYLASFSRRVSRFQEHDHLLQYLIRGSMSVKVFRIKGYIKLALPYRLEARDNNLSHGLVDGFLDAYNAPTACQAAAD